MMHSKAAKLFFALLILSGEIVSYDSLAETGKRTTYPETPADFAKLPPYCYARIKQKLEPAGQMWKSRMGDSCYTHVHHYCSGQHLVNYAYSEPSKKSREAIITQALENGFDYMWNAAGPSCGLMPEIMVNRGKALLMADRASEALESFRKAIELNQRYIPAYAELATLYAKSGQADVARTILDYALKVDPNSKLIQRQLTRLQGGAKQKSAKAESDRQ
jgi:tetratricopeptide (TPR) repeat protein